MNFLIYCFFSDSLPGKTSTSTCVLCTFYNILTFMFVAGVHVHYVCVVQKVHRHLTTGMLYVQKICLLLFQKHSTVPSKPKFISTTS